MIKHLFTNAVFIILFASVLSSCGSEENKQSDLKVVFNILQPSADIYAIVEKDVPNTKTTNQYFEKNTFENNKLVKIERFDKSGKLTDSLFIPAVTTFKYDSQNRVVYLNYYDKNRKIASHPKFNYSTIEYIYDEKGRVILEIYRDKNNRLLTIPKDFDEKLLNNSFLPPVLAYVYTDGKTIIKAFDKNFTFLKETTGKKPCIPFIDCGDNN